MDGDKAGLLSRRALLYGGELISPGCVSKPCHHRQQGLRHARAQLETSAACHHVQATAVDNEDGSYALQFRLPLVGAWQLIVNVNGAEVPCPAAAAIPAAYGRLTAAECEIEGVEGAVACGTSDPIFIQVEPAGGCP